MDSDKIVLAVSTVAMGLPSAWTLSWASHEKGNIPFLWWNMAGSFICLVGALADIDLALWGGFGMVVASYVYVLLQTLGVDLLAM